MKTSNHAQKRQQQRCISEDTKKFVFEYGTPISKQGNALEYRILNKDKARIINELKHQIKAVEKASNIGILTSDNGETIITTYHLK